MRRPPKGVPRDEWLLAIGLANHGARRHADYVNHGFVHWVAAWVKDAAIVTDPVGQWLRDDDSDELSAMAGAYAMRRPERSWPFCRDHGNPDAFAAGAALAMALEGA